MYISRSMPPKLSGLKRAYGSSNPSPLPLAPKLENEVYMEVYTHPSIKPPYGFRNDNFGDSARLAELGSHVLPMVVTWCLFSKQPLLTADEIKRNRAEILSDANINSWLTGYKMRENIRAGPEVTSKLDTPEVCLVTIVTQCF